MKNITKIMSFSLFLTPILFFANLSFGQKDFNSLKSATDSSYGYTEGNPLPMKKGKYSNRINYIMDFLSGLKTEDDQALTLAWRIAYSHSYLDKFVLVTSKTKDTLTIFTDLQKKGEIKLPIGLKYKQNQK